MNRNRKDERGVTMMVVAFTLVAILAMAALSIDVAELYVSRGEAQRAADAAALAGAKMFVTSGVTSVLGSLNVMATDPTTVCASGPAGSTAAANVQAEAVATQNLIAGQPAVVTSITCDTSDAANPKITVSVTRTGVPTFFARIWGYISTNVNATATAEAYNPSGTVGNSESTPIATSIKPWLVPNCDPNSGVGPCTTGYFIDPANGNVRLNGSFIGTTIDLKTISSGAGSGNAGTLSSYSLRIPAASPAPLCPDPGSVPACGGILSSSYFDNIACSSQVPVSCGEQIGNGGGATISVQTGGTVPGQTISGGECLIHASGTNLGQGQDSLTSVGPPPAVIQGGDNNPDPNFRGVPNISRSDSIVTVPLYDGSILCTAGFGGCFNRHEPVIGFLQLAITQADPTGSGTPQLEAVILNASGCSPASIAAYGSVTPVTGSGTTPVPVRLIHN
jgi:hypothetical protein